MMVTTQAIKTSSHRQISKTNCEVPGNSVVLTPEHPVRYEREYVIAPLTGLRVTKVAGDAEPVTSEMIKALLEDYP